MSEVSADFPDSLRGPHCPVRHDPHNKNLRKIMASRGSQIRGKNIMESSVSGKPVTKKVKSGEDLLNHDFSSPEGDRSFVTFNPSVMKASVKVAPPRQPIANGLDMTTIDQFRHRLASAFENRHAELLASDESAFFKDSGELEMFIDQGGRNIDLLPAWQHTHPRDLDDKLRLKIPRAKSEFYFDRYNTPFSKLKEFSHTERLATSSILRARHLEARAKREKHMNNKQSTKVLGEKYNHHDNAHKFQMKNEKKNKETNNIPSGSGDLIFNEEPVKNSERIIASETVDHINKFERKHHQLFDLRDKTKVELKEVINREGGEEPGKLVWDGNQCVFKKLPVKKGEYLDLAEKLLVEGDEKPIVQRGKLIMNEITIPGTDGKLDTVNHVTTYCLLSVFALRNNAVMLEVYIGENQIVLRKLLSAQNLFDADFESCPSSQNQMKWEKWSKVLFDRLKIIDTSDIILVPPLGFKNKGNSKPEAKKHYNKSIPKIPNGYSLQSNTGNIDRRHVTEYFK